MNNFIPRGQVSTILLSCLLERDQYGAELLNTLSQQTDNQVSIKSPTLYNTLARMEKQGLISSYWRDAKVGAKRHYYTLTELGKKTLAENQSVIMNFEDEKYDEIGDFEKKDDQPFVQSNSEREIFEENKDLPQPKDDGVFLEPDEYIIPSPTNAAKKYDEIDSFDKSNGGVFITERLPKEQIRKVKKVDELYLSIAQQNAVAQKLVVPSREPNYNEKLKELYNKIGEGNFQTFEKPSEIQDLQQRYDNMNIKYYASSVNNRSIEDAFGKVPTSKLFAKFFTIFCFALLVSAGIYLFYSLNLLPVVAPVAYIIVPCVFALPALFFLLSKRPYRKILKTRGVLPLSIALFVVGVLICFSVNMLVYQMNFANCLEYCTTFLYPAILMFSFVISGIFDHVFLKKYCL